MKVSSPALSLAAAMQAAIGARAATVASEASMTLLGFGGSGAWWPYDLYNFPDAVRANLSSFLFSDTGLGLTSYRYNIGGGGVNVSNPTRAPETFMLITDACRTYNWDADAPGRYFLYQAQEVGGDDLKITMLVNSAPAAMTLEHASCGTNFANGENGRLVGRLRRGRARALPGGRRAVSKIAYVSPMHEPDSNFGPSPCGQEGMEVTQYQRPEMITALYNALVDRNLQDKIGILADESSSLSRGCPRSSIWKFAAPSAKQTVPAAAGREATIPRSRTLMWSGMVYQSILVAGEAHYDHWTLVSGGIWCDPLDDASCVTTPNADGWTMSEGLGEGSDGVIYYDDDYATNGIYLTKHLRAYKHLGNFVKPGASLHTITNSSSPLLNLTIVVGTPSGDAFNVISKNPTTEDVQLEFSFSTCVEPTAAYRTSAEEDVAELEAADVVTAGEEGWVLTVSATSQMTFVFGVVDC
ncbi:hypothetical protein K525DRAFT_250757 [Schizophyllum commune Loenen D]|nr:hypothetical protein K525DRAFT_250757 [Schizophyllum commune Loenen D]